MIYTLGETVMDIPVRNGKPVSMVPGGAMLNSCISLGRLNVPVAFIGEFGKDPAGDLVIRFLEKNGIETGYIYRYQDGKTTVSLAFLDENNDASYSFYQDFPEKRLQVEIPPFREGDILLFGSFFALNREVRPKLLQIIYEARNHGVLIIYDPNFRMSHLRELPALKPVILENMELADIVRGSDEDFRNIFGAGDAGEARKVLPASCRYLVYTASSREVQFTSPEEKIVLPVQPVKTVSTIGAGDTFNAGIAYGLHSHEITRETLEKTGQDTWKTILETAMRMSADVCKHYDNYISPGLAVKMIRKSGKKNKTFTQTF
ncbi:MAG: carbohydrate kinase [Chlorobi bacterium]|nr:carbohydrate kinase [Chlorobiota bacterium]